jgi:ligand-binding SRPBCC domain-containing protein
MKIYHYSRSQKLPITQDVAWAFFSNPANLLQLTPAWAQMTDESPEKFKTIFTGMIQLLKIKLPLGIPGQWLATITHVEAPHYFIDEQKAGPFRFWQHRHQIVPIAGGVEVLDTIYYAIPFGVFGEIAHKLFVRNQLHELFDYRAHALEDFFGTMPSQPV